jgi:hypothetical protein
MNKELIEAQVSAICIACGRMTVSHLSALQHSVDQAFATPAVFGWDRRAAGYAEILNVLADAAADDAITAQVLSGGVGLVYDLMVAVGPAVDGMTASSCRRLLAHLRAGDAEGVALELEKQLRVLHFMWRLATCGPHCASVT